MRDAIQKDIDEARAYFASGSPDRQGYRDLGRNRKEYIRALEREGVQYEHLYDDPEVAHIMEEFTNLLSMIDMLIGGGRRKRGPRSRKTLRKKRTHTRRHLRNLTLRRRVRA